MDLEDIPLLYKLLYSSSDNLRKERQWLLSMLKNGLYSNDDLILYEKRHVAELLMGLFSGGLAGKGNETTIIEILKKISKFEASKNLGIFEFIQKNLSTCHSTQLKSLIQLYQECNECNEKGRNLIPYIQHVFNNRKEEREIIVDISEIDRIIEKFPMKTFFI
jgi:hypothetical protein